MVSPQGATHTTEGQITPDREARPNGIAAMPDGRFLFADLGADSGGVYVLDQAGRISPWLQQVDGFDLPPTNFPLIDRWGRTWITVSTRVTPRADDYRPGASSGFIVLVDSKGSRIVADALGYANECALSADGIHLFVNETFARRLTRFTVAPSGALINRVVISTFGAGTFPDGLALDAEDHLWVTSIVSNRVIRVAPNGAQRLMLEDASTEHINWVENAFQSGTMGRPHLDKCAGRVLKNISSLAFGGSDMRTGYLGCLQGDRIARFRSPVAGATTSHTEFSWH